MLEAWRVLSPWCQPRTPGILWTIFGAIPNRTLAKDLVRVDNVSMRVEDLSRRCEELASHPRSKDVKVSVILDLCPKNS